MVKWFMKQIHLSWDGNFEGEPQEMGTYVWQVTASFNNGDAYQGSGNVILVR